MTPSHGDNPSDRFRSEINGLPKPELARLCCAISECMFDSYTEYCKFQKNTSALAFRAILDNAWYACYDSNYLSSTDLAEYEAELSDTLDSVVASESPWSMSAVAENALVALIYTLRVSESQNGEDAFWCLGQLLDAADTVLQAAAPLHTYVDTDNECAPTEVARRVIADLLQEVTENTLERFRDIAKEHSIAISSAFEVPLT